MKHNISIAVVALAVVFAGCNARSGSANKVTVAGCVQSAEQGLASSNDKNDITRFMLTNVNAASSTGAAPSSPAPNGQPTTDQPRSDQARSDASAPPAATPIGTMYILDGKASELREHLNHQVEITGRLDRDADAKDSSSATPDRGQQLHVDSVRMIAANCNQ